MIKREETTNFVCFLKAKICKVACINDDNKLYVERDKKKEKKRATCSKG